MVHMVKKIETNKKMAFIFAGIGADYRNLIDKFDSEQMETLNRLSYRAFMAFDIDIASYLTNKKTEEEYNTLTIWSSIYTCDYIVYHTYIKAGINPSCFLGFSMGLITALACADSITYENGIEILKEILNYHKIKEEEGMATIIGFTYEELSQIIKDCSCDTKAFIACENNEYCFGVAGTKEAVLQVADMALNQGALKVYKVDTAFAFHTDMFREGCEQLRDCVNRMVVKDLEVPLVSTINQSYLYHSEDLKKELVCNMYSKMLWRKSIEIVSLSKPVEFIEVGLGKSISKASKLIKSGNKFYSYDSIFKNDSLI